MNRWIEAVTDTFRGSRFAVQLADATLKSLIVLALAGIACALWRRASAATRHFIWFLAVMSLLCLPLASSVLPSWQKQLWALSTDFNSGNRISLGVEFAPTRQSNATSADQQTTPNDAQQGLVRENEVSHKFSAQFNANWFVAGFAVWIGCAALILSSIAAAQIRLRKFSSDARLLDSADWRALLREARDTLHLKRSIILLQSAGNVMPLTWGWLRPVVLLPADCESWPADRRKIVLFHELAHVKRFDCLTQMLAQIVCALYWFNPLVWLAAKQMHIERERACDDLVLSGGCRASDYAEHLVEIAATFRRTPQLAAAVAMARPSGLEQRVAAIVDATRVRSLKPLTMLMILLATSGIIFAVGACKSNSVEKKGSETDPLRRQQLARLRDFSKLKFHQSQILAAAAGENISPEFQRYFDAAINGDSQTVTNMYESFKRRHPQYGKPGQHSDLSLRTSYWQPVLEISLAYDHVVRCEPKYTQIAVDGIIDSIPRGSIYFGGTDPGRGLPTAFSKSQPEADPFYTLTQNALADGTYLEYLQNNYGERAKLLEKFGTMRRADKALSELDAQWRVAVKKLDSIEIKDDSPEYAAAQKAVDELDEKRDERAKQIFADVQVRAKTSNSGNGKESIYIPTGEDSQKCFQDYIQDATQRNEKHQLKPGENFVKTEDGRIQVSGQVAVMEINARLAKIVFDKNPGHEFFIEESFPLDWMFPYLEPHGLIMKINREPMTEMPNETVQQDREYWQKLVHEMVGGWLNADTSIGDVAGFAEKVFVHHDLSEFAGDAKYVQNDYACRMFSKLRSSIAGVYAWRAEHGAAAEKDRMARAADLAFRQAFALCSYSPEAANRYANFLKAEHRDVDAELIFKIGEKIRIKSQTAIAAPSVFQMRLVLDEPAGNSEVVPVQQSQSGGTPQGREFLNVAKTVLLDHTAVRSAKLNKNRLGYPEIEFTLNEAGLERFAEITRENLHKRLAIVIDGKVWTAPVIQSEISGGKGVITGSFSDDEAKSLVAKINEAVRRK